LIEQNVLEIEFYGDLDFVLSISMPIYLRRERDEVPKRSVLLGVADERQSPDVE